MRKFIFVLLFSPMLLKAACCCTPASCLPTEASVKASVEKTIEGLKNNDKEYYAKALNELNNELIKLNNLKNAIDMAESEVVLMAQARAVLKNEAAFHVKKTKTLIELDTLLTIAISKNQITSAELELIALQVQALVEK